MEKYKNIILILKKHSELPQFTLIAFVRQMANITFILWCKCYIFDYQDECEYLQVQQGYISKI